MARRRDDARKLTAPAVRPPLQREFSAGGLVYRRRAGETTVVLVARRRAETGPLVWGLPKGHLEPGESSEEAAVREVQEETGLEAVIEERLGDITYWFAKRERDGSSMRILKRVRFFLMRYQRGRFADRDDEMDAVRWFRPAEAEKVAAYENERELVRRARELLEARRP